MALPDDVLPLSEIGHADPAGGIAVHASAVTLTGQGVLLFGPSGTGKSQTALSLMAFGAGLVSDDRVLVTEGPVLLPPKAAPSLIEARGIGLLAADLVGSAPLSLAVDLGRSEPARLPPSRFLDAFGVNVPLILAAGHPNLASSLLHLLRKGRAR